MTLSSWTLSSTKPADVVMSPDGTILYAAGNDGNIRVYDLTTNSLLATWDVGIDLGGIDISQDGSFLIVVEDQEIAYNAGEVGWTDDVSTITAYKVSTATGHVTGFPTTVTGMDRSFYDVAVLADGTALLTGTFAGSGWVQLQMLDPETGEYTMLGGVTQNSTLTRSADGTNVFIAEGNISDARVALFRLGEGIVAAHLNYDDNVSGFNGGVEAVSAAGGFLVQLGSIVYDDDLKYLFDLRQTLSHLTGISALTFDASGENLYALDVEADVIVQISTSDWQVVRTFDIGADLGSFASGEYGNRLLLSPDGSFFTLIGDNGIRIVTDSAEINSYPATSGNDKIVAARGNDVIDGGDGADSIWGGMGTDDLTGGAGNDFIDGGLGADVMHGGTGDDVYIVDDLGDQATENAEEGLYDQVTTGLGAGAVLQQRIANQYALPSNVEALMGDTGEQGLRGNSGDNLIWSLGGDDFINVSDGGIDQVDSGDGRDVIYYGAALTNDDVNYGGLAAGDPRGDLLILQGDYAITLGYNSLAGIEKLRLLKGSNTTFGDVAGNLYDYNITILDSSIGSYPRLVVQGGSLQIGEHLRFDGSAETDGSFQIFGGHDSDELIGGGQGDHLLGRAGNDILTGNGGDDRLRGGLGADTMDGGSGPDIFVYAAQAGDEPYSNAALESTGAGYDTIVGFDFASDKIELPQSVSALASLDGGTLNTASFDADLAAAVDASLVADGAVLFTADDGDESGKTFLLVDADGDGSYQVDHDFVIQLVGATGAVPPAPDFFV